MAEVMNVSRRVWLGWWQLRSVMEISRNSLLLVRVKIYACIVCFTNMRMIARWCLITYMLILTTMTISDESINVIENAWLLSCRVMLAGTTKRMNTYLTGYARVLVYDMLTAVTCVSRLNVGTMPTAVTKLTEEQLTSASSIRHEFMIVKASCKSFNLLAGSRTEMEQRNVGITFRKPAARCRL